jgi:hypothetical protein
MAHRHMEANAAKGGDAEIGGPLTHSTDLRTSSFRNDLHNKLLAARMREMLTEDMSWKRRIFGIGALPSTFMACSSFCCRFHSPDNSP